jgi:LysM repeat protein
VSVSDLRAANENMELRANRILQIPPRMIVAMEPVELTQLREGSTVIETPVAMTDDDLRAAPMVDAEEATTAVLIRPEVTRETKVRASHEESAKPTAEKALPAANRKHTVKNGDTFWKIAKTYGTTPDIVMKVNRITDPRKLRAGMKLMVP